MSEIQIVFMRHGRSRAGDEGVFEGRYDSPLTQVGQEQARQRALGWRKEGVCFDRIIASTLLRALETAEIIGEILESPVETDPDWMEMDNRPLAGLTFAEGEARYPVPAFRNPYEPFHGIDESDWEVYCRAARGVENVVRRGKGSYLVVAHGGIMNPRIEPGGDLPVLLFERQQDWTAWLDENHAASRGVWLQIAKKAAEIRSVSYDEAVEAVLCYGWIDGQKKSYDESSWLQKFTPRGPKSIWSKINRERAE